MGNVLMVAFHFPPYSGGSGVLRTLKFCRYLPDYGWEPTILTAHPRAYSTVGMEQVSNIPSAVPVHRAFAVDSGRHFSICGSYPKFLALPDRWVSWWLGGVWEGLKIIKSHRPHVIWSTYPIATAHLVGLTLHRLFGIPWVADFRDSMTEENYPSDPTTRKWYRWIERKVLEQSTKAVFTTPSTQAMYLKRYPHRQAESCMVIGNGFDEGDFDGLPTGNVDRKRSGERVRFLHAGVIYPHERNPFPFFRALSRLKKQGLIQSHGIQVDLRASGSEHSYRQAIKELDIQDIVFLLPFLSYKDSLKDAAETDVLLLMQGSTCNHQIPAKVYEYLRLERPILALTDQGGDTASVLNECGGATIMNMMDEEEIVKKLPSFLQSVRGRRHPISSSEKVALFSRRNQAKQLASELTGIRKNDS